MDSNTPRLCETCGLPYVVDESADSRMDPPDDYRRGYQRYCLACWLGVGPKDDPDLFGGPAQPARSRNANAKQVSGPEIRLNRPPAKKEIREKPDGHRPPQTPSVYLWLCCEGWMKFGPFEWLRFDDERQAILGPDGEEVAKKSEGYWRMPDGRGKGMQFSNPTITSSPIHPHRDCGSHPGRIR